jgi:SAM-dependent methyltransferase
VMSALASVTTVCPFCGSEELVEFSGRPAARCARCDSLERQRGLAQAQAGLLAQGDGRRALEAGALNARVFGGYLRERGWVYTSVDRSRKGNPHDPRDTAFIDLESDLCELTQVASDSVSLFLAQHVIEEIPDYRAALGEIARVLAEDGVALLEIPFDPGKERSQSQPPGAFGNVWVFGADLTDYVREHFGEVEVLSYTDGAFRGVLHVCRNPSASRASGQS